MDIERNGGRELSQFFYFVFDSSISKTDTEKQGSQVEVYRTRGRVTNVVSSWVCEEEGADFTRPSSFLA